MSQWNRKKGGGNPLPLTKFQIGISHQATWARLSTLGCNTHHDTTNCCPEQKDEMFWGESRSNLRWSKKEVHLGDDKINIVCIVGLVIELSIIFFKIVNYSRPSQMDEALQITKQSFSSRWPLNNNLRLPKAPWACVKELKTVTGFSKCIVWFYGLYLHLHLRKQRGENTQQSGSHTLVHQLQLIASHPAVPHKINTMVNACICII